MLSMRERKPTCTVGCVGAMGSGGPPPAAGKSKLIMADMEPGGQ